ncbi:MAG: cytochrome c [Acidobacteria bacterium]|nr:cytochrome c [Acidobacteriota bacterium]MBI3422008.1 cytochrome c [Acidobacteriota bacterium]
MRKKFESHLNRLAKVTESISVLYLLATALLLIVLGSVACSNSSTTSSPPTTSPATTSKATSSSVILPADVTEKTQNPLPDKAAAAAGMPLYQANCALCHGDTGAGDGPASASFDPKPTHLAKDDVINDPDGELFLVLKKGKGKMPAMKKMTDEQMWQVVAYVRTLAKQ